MELYESSEASKMIFAGLDKAGKSSIILTLKKEIGQIEDLVPTRSVERRQINFMDKKIVAWDLGGQQTYRKEYFEKPAKYFDNSKNLIYVIDIQDTERYEQSVNYLLKIVRILRKFGSKCSVSILFHKMDPDYKEKEGEKLNKVILKLSKDLSAVIHRQYKLKLFETSINKENSITEAFSKILL